MDHYELIYGSTYTATPLPTSTAKTVAQAPATTYSNTT